MPEKQTKSKLTPVVVKRISLGVILAAVVLILLLASNTEFLQGALRNLAQQGRNVDINTATIVVEYIKIPDKNELQIGSESESLGKYRFEINNESVLIEAFTFEMEGNIVKESFNDLKIVINDEAAENAEFLWRGKGTLIVYLTGDNIELKNDMSVELLGDIVSGEPGQMFAFHFVDINASGKNSKKRITSVGVNGDITPMPQIHILK